MFSKTVFVCLLAVYLVQPSESQRFPVLDLFFMTPFPDLVSQANTVAQAAASQAVTGLLSLQTAIQSTTSSLQGAPSIETAVNASITNWVLAAGGDQSKVASCTSQYRSSIAAFEASAPNSIVSACMNFDIPQALSLISTVSSLANNLTNTVVGKNETVMAACPPPASGDLLGGIFNAVCSMGMIGGISGEVTFQAIALAFAVAQAEALVNPMLTAAPGIATCVQDQLTLATPGAFATSLSSTISPIVMCTLF